MEERMKIESDKKHGVTINGRSAAHYIEVLVCYGEQKEIISFEDYYVVRNVLFELFSINKASSRRVYRTDNPIKLDDALLPLIEIGVQKGLCESGKYEREQFGTKIMGLLTPWQSEVLRRFRERCSVSPKQATDWYFAFSRATGYIKDGNSIRWKSVTEFGELEITINLAKPEKDPRDIAKAAGASLRGEYPKCLLCPQTAGFMGKPGFPARNNHRPVRFKNFGGQGISWYFQYSPYQYYNEHCILLYENHLPMRIDAKTFECLFDFVDMFPHYFIGSNADLPIVGGSILGHEHYQGGRHEFPIEKAEALAEFRNERFNTDVSIVNWPLSTIRLKGSDRRELASCAVHILKAWKSYSDGVIVPFTEGDAEVSRKSGAGYKKFIEKVDIRHSTVTPILRKRGVGGRVCAPCEKTLFRSVLQKKPGPKVDGRERLIYGGKSGAEEYELDIVLRSNLTSEENPLGIYHPHSDVWHIKKENIGLIEVMGLAVLPARLADEIEDIRMILQGKLNIGNGEAFFNEYTALLPHKDWIIELLGKYGADNSPSRSGEIIEAEVAAKFARVLSDCGVFGTEGEGLSRFRVFMSSAGFEEQG